MSDDAIPWLGSEIIMDLDDEDTKKIVISKCKYKYRVRVGSLPNSSMNEENLKKTLRSRVSHDIRFALKWPICTITLKEIPLIYEVNETSHTMNAYFLCPDCSNEYMANTTWP
jgi:hypothetical protein